MITFVATEHNPVPEAPGVAIGGGRLKKYLRERGYSFEGEGATETDKAAFERLSREYADNRPQLERFLADVAAFYQIRFMGRCDDLVVDKDALEEIGGKTAKAKGCVPVKGGLLLSRTPHLDVQCRGQKLVLTFPANIHALLQDVSALDAKESEDPALVLNDILERAVLRNISDVHIEPREGQTVVRCRQDGILKEMVRYNGGQEFHEHLVNKIYELSQLEASRFGWLSDSSFSANILGRRIYVRVSSVPIPPHASGFDDQTTPQASVVLRLLYRKAQGITPLDELGYSQESITTIKDLIRLPYGIIFMVGPTGSGKTTSLYSMMDIKRKEPIKLLAVEDPVEIPLDGIMQIEVCKERNVTFANTIRSFLRQDPDVILVGEVRDAETAEEAIRASLTGHLVFATLHANTSAETIPRLLNLGVSMDQLLSTVKGCIAQRLVRKLCPACKRHVPHPSQSPPEYMAPDEFTKTYGNLFDESGFWLPQGCPECDGEGYKGRTVIWEILIMTTDVKEHVAATHGFINNVEAMRLCGQKTMRETGLDLIRAGVTSIDEVARFVPISNLMGQLL